MLCGIIECILTLKTVSRIYGSIRCGVTVEERKRLLTLYFGEAAKLLVMEWFSGGNDFVLSEIIKKCLAM